MGALSQLLEQNRTTPQAPTAAAAPPQSSDNILANLLPDARDYIGKTIAGSGEIVGRLANILGFPVRAVTNPSGIQADLAGPGDFLGAAKDQIGQDLGQFAQDPTGTIVKHPFESTMNLLGILAPITKALELASIGGKVAPLARAASVTGSVGRTIDPLTVAGKLIGKIGEANPAIATKLSTVTNRFVEPDILAATKRASAARISAGLSAKALQGELGKLITTPEEGAAATQEIQRPGSVANLSPEVGAAVKPVKDLFAKFGSSEMAQGILKKMIPDYSLRLYEESPEKVQQAVNDYVRSKTGNPLPGSSKSRVVPEEVYWKAFQDPAFAKSIGLTPVRDIRVLAPVRQYMHDLATSKAAVIDAAVKAPLEKGATTYLKDIPELAGKAFTPQTAEIIKQALSPAHDLGGFEKIAKGFNDVMKRGMFAMPNSPTFHVRNLATLAYFSPANPFNPANWDHYAKALDEVMSKGPNYRTLLANGAMHGETSSGISTLTKDLGSELLPKSKWDWAKTRLNPFSGQALHNQALYKLDEVIRTALGSKLIDQGLSPADAAKAVNHYMVDYGNLTPFERHTLVHTAPFYAWTKGVVPALVHALFESPEKFFPLKEAGDLTPHDERGRISEGSSTMNANLPLKDINSILTNPGRFAVAKANPALAILMALFGQQLGKEAPGVLPEYNALGTRGVQVIPGVGPYVDPRVNAILQRILPVSSLAPFNPATPLNVAERLNALTGGYSTNPETTNQLKEAKQPKPASPTKLGSTPKSSTRTTQPAYKFGAKPRKTTKKGGT